MRLDYCLKAKKIMCLLIRKQKTKRYHCWIEGKYRVCAGLNSFPDTFVMFLISASSFSKIVQHKRNKMMRNKRKYKHLSLLHGKSYLSLHILNLSRYHRLMNFFLVLSLFGIKLIMLFFTMLLINIHFKIVRKK